MCGISGIFEYRTGHSVDRARLQRMSNTLIHRGPDEEGFLVKPGIGMAVRRPSIFDGAGRDSPPHKKVGVVCGGAHGAADEYLKHDGGIVGSGGRARETCEN